MEFDQKVFEWPLDKIIDGLCADIHYKNSSKSRMFPFNTKDNRDSLWQLELKSTVTGISIMLTLCSDTENCFLTDFEIDLYSVNNSTRIDQMKWASCKKKETFSNENRQFLIYSFMCTNALKYLHGQNHSFTISLRMNLKLLGCKIDNVPSSVPDFENLMHNTEFSDLILIAAKSGKEFKLHRNILAARSKPLSVMIKHGMRGARKDVEIKIEDFDDDVIQEMIRYIYCGKVNNLSRLSVELLKAAEKYDIDGLKTKCLEDFCKSMNIESACEVLQLLNLYNCKELITQAVDFIVYNLQHIDGSALESLDCPDLLKKLFFKTISVYAMNK